MVFLDSGIFSDFIINRGFFQLFFLEKETKKTLLGKVFFLVSLKSIDGNFRFGKFSTCSGLIQVSIGSRRADPKGAAHFPDAFPNTQTALFSRFQFVCPV
jgi:hypothetical protein